MGVAAGAGVMIGSGERTETCVGAGSGGLVGIVVSGVAEAPGNGVAVSLEESPLLFTIPGTGVNIAAYRGGTAPSG